MSDEPTTAKEAEIEDRRMRVLALRLRRMSEPAIAAILNVSHATVSRDLQWIKEHWRKQYGVPAGLNPQEFIGETIAVYQDHEAAAMLEYHDLKQQAANRRLSPMFVSRARMQALRTAMAARQLQVNLLQDLGLVDRELGSVDVRHRVAKADDIRQLLREEGLLPEGPRRGVPADTPEEVEGDVIARWLHGPDGPQ
jgi:hypothetical protein